jgi:RNA polymerase sigma factor (sigma-70 family)
MTGSDAALLERWWAARDADAFAEIVARHSGMVYATCRRILGNPADAEDVAQECFLELLGLRKAVRSYLGGWLHQVAAHRSLDRLKAEHRRRRREERFAGAQAAGPDPTWDDIKPHLDAAVAALPREVRDAVVLRFLEGCTHEATATELGIPRTTAQYRIERGVECIRLFLKRRGIVVPGALLIGWMAGRTAEAAPRRLTAAVGERVLAGFVPEAPSLVTLTLGTLFMSKKITVIVGAVLLLIAGFFGVQAYRRSGPAPGARERAATGPAIARKAESPAGGNVRPSPASGQAPLPAEAPATAAAGAEDAVVDSGRDEKEEAPPRKVLSPPATISGTVYDEATHPLPGARVFLEATDNIWGPGAAAMYKTTTDESGRYTIADMDAITQAYGVSAVAPGYCMQTRAFESPAPGAQLTVDITLTKVQAVLRGRVVTERREPVPEVRVELLLTLDQRAQPVTRRHGSRFSFAYTDANGSFELAAAKKGLCDVCVLAEGSPPAVFSRLETGEEPHELVLSEAMASIAGKVTTLDGTPGKGYRVAVQFSYNDGGPGQYDYRIGQAMTEVDAEGNYAFEDLGPTLLYTVAVFPPGPGKYLDVKDGVRVRPNEVTRIDFAVQEPARLVGRVAYTDGSPIPEALQFRACEADGPGREVGVPDRFDRSEGSYSLPLAIRGEKSVRIVIDSYYAVSVSGTPRVVDADGALVGGPSIVTLSPGEEKRLDLEFELPLTLEVKAVDPEGSPLPDLVVGVGIVGPDGQRRPAYPRFGVTDRTGSCACRYLSSGKTCYAWLSPGAEDLQDPEKALAESQPVTGKPGETVPVVIVVERRGGLEGVLVDAAGEPLAGRRLTATARLPDGPSRSASGKTDASGHFALVRALPPGRYEGLEIAVPAEGQGPALKGSVSRLDVAADDMENVGKVACGPAE